MKKSDLKTGHVVEFRRGSKYLVMLGHCDHHSSGILCRIDDNITGWMSLDDYDENMICERYSEFDIVRVYESQVYNIRDHTFIWKRKEEKPVVTIDGVEYSESTLRSLIKKATRD